MRLTFLSSNSTWGGSEELWSAAAAVLASEGHAVTVFKNGIDDSEPRIARLRELGCTIRDLSGHLTPRRFTSSLVFFSYPGSYGLQLARLWRGLRFAKRPDLAVISQGGNADGIFFAEMCLRLGIPYVIISQKASDLYWPTDARRERLRVVYQQALAAYFVSEHNLRLTEEQLGMDLPRASIVRNPFLVPVARRNDWPEEKDGIRLACIGRLYPMEKGQDLLLRVLARDQWRERPVSVTFYGSGNQRAGLEGMAQRLGLTNVTFAGFVRDVGAIWDDHHGLVLPARCEGLPLVLVEAMWSARVSIVTDAGGNAEILDDGVTGFLADGSDEDALDEAMERAWQRRDEWRAIGEVAATRIRELVPQDPAQVMAETLLRVLRSAGVPAG